MPNTSSTLIAVVLVLLSLGIVVLASTSSVKGDNTFGDPYYFLKKQAVWIVLALCAAAVAYRLDYHVWRRLSVGLMIGSTVLLCLVFVPGIGVHAGGSSRWIGLGPVTFQPSELARFSVVVLLSAWLAALGRRTENLREGLVLPLAAVGVVLILLMKEPDFGATFLTGTVAMVLLFAAGARLSYLIVTGTLGACGFILAVLHDPIRMSRIFAFLAPHDPVYTDKAYQLIQSKNAFIAGGWFGVGLGESMQKQLYLPEPHTDSIFAIIGEEMGFPATILVLVLYMIFIVFGFRISFRAQDRFGKLLAFGLTMAIGMQAAINMGVVTGCLPTKGLPLPFISYGGSNLVMCLTACGILLNIARQCPGDAEAVPGPIKDRARRL
ncbi:MAG: putative lipid II flippase FtsW [Kiritimatiellia bacterium]